MLILAGILCALAFGLTFLAARRSLTAGLIAVLVSGYAYGIVRANVPVTLTYFLFDCSVIALYAAQLFRPAPTSRQRSQLLIWVLILSAWPLFLLALPSEHGHHRGPRRRL